MPSASPCRIRLALVVALAGCGRIHALAVESGDAAGVGASDGGQPGDGGPPPDSGDDRGPDQAPEQQPDVQLDARDPGPEAAVDVAPVSVDGAPASADMAPELTACALPFVDRWDYPLSPTSQPWHLAFGDPAIDRAAQELNLTHDDVARRAPLAGGYQLSFDLRLEGDLTFLPGPPGVFTYQPAITRKGQDLVLIGHHYAESHAEPVGAFVGQSLAAGLLRVTLFVKRTSSQMALRVRAGGVTYRSGFIEVIGSLSDMQLIGNNDATGDGPARVGVITGCAGMTDLEVQASYDQ